MQTKEADENPANGSGFKANPSSILFNKPLLKESPKTIQPTAAAIKEAEKCIQLLPSTMKQDVEKRVLDMFNAHAEWVQSENIFTRNTNDRSYIAPGAKWKLNVPASDKVRQTMAYKSLVTSLDKDVDKCKQSITKATVAVQHLSRDNKRQHTISLAWNVLLKITRCTLRLVINSKPSDILTYQSVVEMISREYIMEPSLFGCHWGLALKILDDMSPVKLTQLLTPSDPNFVENVYKEYEMKLNNDKSNTDWPYAPPADKTSQEVVVTTGSTNSTNGISLPTNTTANVNQGSPITTNVTQLLVGIQTGTKNTRTLQRNKEDSSNHVILRFSLTNSKNQPINGSDYSNNLQFHIDKFLKALVFEGEEDCDNLTNHEYTHKNILVKKNTLPPIQRARTSTATSTPSGTATSASESTPEQRRNPYNTPTHANAVNTQVERITEAAVDQRTSEIASPPLQDNASRNETDVATTDNVEANSRKDEFSSLSNEQQNMIISSIRDALNGLILVPFEQYKIAQSALEQGLTLAETLLESNKSEMADDALELVNKEKTVTPPILNGAIKKAVNPVDKRVKKLEHQRASEAGLTKNQQRKQKNKQKNNQKKQQKRKQVQFEGTQGEDGDGGGNNDDSTATKNRQRKKPKNSDSHPASAVAVTQKKNQNTKQNDNQKGKGQRKRKDKEKNSQQHSQQQGKGSNGQQQKRRGSKNMRRN